MKHTFRNTGFAWLALLPCAVFAADDEAGVFLRIQRNLHGQPSTLQVATKSYVPQDRSAGGLRVDLIAAVHVGEAAYYADLNDRFREYDVVLYELIAPEANPVPRNGERRDGLISSTQMLMTRALELSFQLDEIDYGAANFVHADLSPDEVSQSMDERGESLYTYFWKLFYVSIDEYARDPLGLRNYDLIATMLASDEENALKILVATQLLEMKSVTAIFEGDEGSTIIAARNLRALEVLRQQIAAGDRYIGIFYGAAHMHDMERRLQQDFGLQISHTIWSDAWLLRADTDN